MKRNLPLTTKATMKAAVAAAALALTGQAMADITFYENENFRGRTAGAGAQVNFLGEIGFDDRASSIEVRGERWEVCEDPGYTGRCRVLQPGSYPSLRSMGLDNRISSARRIDERSNVDNGRYGPEPQPTFYRRGEEGLYQAQVVSVRAVMGDEQQRCWIEQKEVRDRPNVGGAVIGGVLGGILGHQFGGGSGQAVTTAAGAIGGAVVGSNVNRDRDVRNVQRCGAAPNNGNPQYWDVTYRFKGQDHYMQTRRPPGATVTVNARGEPRE
ncbi:beta/gamma crystallin-related protein [Roseateles sp. So40a]|uniref:beta/gamma crystallin-related protein n=1 Tax=Roseateles sp. So40a TaxID=3400226 RepID=UPI003A8BE484